MQLFDFINILNKKIIKQIGSPKIPNKKNMQLFGSINMLNKKSIKPINLPKILNKKNMQLFDSTKGVNKKNMPLKGHDSEEKSVHIKSVI